jgi:hypothetical protein
MNAYELVTGVGELYVAPVGTVFPAVNASPASPWRLLGDTDGGVSFIPDDKVEKIHTDQRTGVVKKTRTEEEPKVKTKFVVHTLENLADFFGLTLTDTAPGSGTIGTREIQLYRGSEVKEFALLFRGSSPYGDYPAQYQLKRGSFDDIGDIVYDKKGTALIPVTFGAMEDLNAATEAERFGKLIAQDAAALA